MIENINTMNRVVDRNFLRIYQSIFLIIRTGPKVTKLAFLPYILTRARSRWTGFIAVDRRRIRPYKPISQALFDLFDHFAAPTGIIARKDMLTCLLNQVNVKSKILNT